MIKVETGKNVFKAERYPDAVVIDVAIPPFKATSGKIVINKIKGDKTIYISNKIAVVIIIVYVLFCYITKPKQQTKGSPQALFSKDQKYMLLKTSVKLYGKAKS